LHTSSHQDGALPHSHQTEACFLLSAAFDFREVKSRSIIDNSYLKTTAFGFQVNVDGSRFRMPKDIRYSLLGDAKASSSYLRIDVFQRFGRAKLCAQSRPARLLIEQRSEGGSQAQVIEER
jgi:hypothetical protein